MRFFTLVVLLNVFSFATTAICADDPVAIARSLGLKHLDEASIVEIVEEDEKWGDTAKKLAAALKDVLEDDKLPASTLSPEEDKAGLDNLVGLVELALTGVTDLLIQPAARASWLSAHETLEKTLKEPVSNEAAGKRWAKQRELYTEVQTQLVKISSFKESQEDKQKQQEEAKRKQDAAKKRQEESVAPPPNIVPARFWMDAAQESQVYRYDQKPIESTKLLGKAFEDAAATPAGATVESLKVELSKDLRAFLKKIRDERTERQYLAWKAFLDMWDSELAEADADTENAFKSSIAAHLRTAYTQAKDEILKLGVTIDNLHQEAADTGELQAAAERGAGLADGSSVGTFHGPPHHARAMSRITRRHYRIMSRIQSRY